jgi:hypothetical protein
VICVQSVDEMLPVVGNVKSGADGVGGDIAPPPRHPPPAARGGGGGGVVENKVCEKGPVHEDEGMGGVGKSLKKQGPGVHQSAVLPLPLSLKYLAATMKVANQDHTTFSQL